MILSNELRLGNFVRIHQQMEKITSIYQQSPVAGEIMIGYEDAAAGQSSCAASDIAAVALTDDMLQAFGFSFHDYFHFWQLVRTDAGNRTEMTIDSDHNLIDFMRRPIVRNITSLHQLQNLYFALHGVELVWDPRSVKTESAEKAMRQV